MRSTDVDGVVAASHHRRLNEAEKLKNEVKQLEHNNLGAGEESRKRPSVFELPWHCLPGCERGLWCPFVLALKIKWKKKIEKIETAIMLLDLPGIGRPGNAICWCMTFGEQLDKVLLNVLKSVRSWNLLEHAVCSESRRPQPCPLALQNRPLSTVFNVYKDV